nr:methyl-accepting chemotaxis protein [Peribacillus sp. BBB004]
MSKCRAQRALNNHFVPKHWLKRGRILCRDPNGKDTNLVIFMKNVEENLVLLNQFFLSITEFVKLVQGLDYQANLLSLNSAIKAPRAGEHDGFAVVSNEVRKLAEQTKKTIAEIDAIVQTSNK